jgi:hypothetical protein
MKLLKLLQNSRVRRVREGLRAQCSGPALYTTCRHVALDTSRKDGFLRCPSTARCRGWLAQDALLIIHGDLFAWPISNTAQSCQDSAVPGS